MNVAKKDNVQICLTNNPEESENDLIRILSTLFTIELNAEKKISLLQQYGVQVSEDYRKEIEHMCNLSEGVWDDGMKEGIRIGETKGILHSSIQMALYLLNNTGWNNQKISEAVANELTSEEVELLRHGKTLN